MVPDSFILRTYMDSPMSFISKTEDSHYLVALIISTLFPTKSMSSTYKVKNMIPFIILLTYTQWYSKIMVKPNNVMASWNLKYHDQEDNLRPYMDLLR